MVTKLVLQADGWLARKARVYGNCLVLFAVLLAYLIVQVLRSGTRGWSVLCAVGGTVLLLIVGSVMGWMLVRERKLLRDAPRRFEWRFCEDSMTIGAAFLHGWADRYARQRGLDALEVSVSQITRIIVFPGGQRGVPMVPDCYELSLKLPYRLDRPRWDTLQSSSTLLIRRQAFYGREREIIEAFERYGIPVELRGSLR